VFLSLLSLSFVCGFVLYTWFLDISLLSLLLLEITLILAMTFIFLHTSKFISVIFSTNSQQLASIVGQSGELVKWVPWVQSGASRSSPEVTMGDRRLR